MKPQRVLSLIASATEIVCALGFEKMLVGRSHECDYPPTVRRLPVCSRPKFSTSASSIEIYRSVKALVRNALSVYLVDADRLRELKPDLIITQSHCEVCAVSLRDLEEALGDWLDSRPKVLSLRPDSLADLWVDIEMVAEALGSPRRGAELVGRIQARMAAISVSIPPAGKRQTVAFIEWLEPLMAGGNWAPELVQMAGGDSLLGETGRHSPQISWQGLRVADPEVIVVAPCGFELERTEKEMVALTGRKGWHDLRAVGNGRVCLADGIQYFNRPGPRLVDSLEILAEILHPDRFDFGHQGRDWRYLYS